MSIVKDMAILMQRWREQPMLFMKQVLNVKQLWSMQSDLCNCLNRAIAENKPIYVASGNGLGKDVICSMVALWFLICFNKSKVILTAPSSRQVEKIMYGYVKKNWDDRNFKDIIKGIPYTSPRIDIDPKDHYLMGFTTKESSGSAGSRFRGIHSDNMCVIVSEAQGIEPQIFDQIKAITTGKNNLVIYIGNPTRAVGDFAKGLKNKTDNIVFNVSCMDNPNYKQRTVVIPGLTTYEWVENRRKDWGETDARWQANVLGQVPDTSINTVLSQDLINTNIKGLRSVSQYWNNIRVTSGDFARFGDDDTCIYNFKEGSPEQEIQVNKASGPENTSYVLTMMKKNESNLFIGDADGVGGPIIDSIEDILRLDGKECVFVHSNGKPESDQYQNLKAEMWFYLQEELREGRVSIPNDSKLIEELMEMQYFVNARGKIQIESKDDLKRRLGRSPDKADAYVMGVYAHKFAVPFKKVDKYYDKFMKQNKRRTFNPHTL